MASSYMEDLWKHQDEHVEVWVEKEALISIIEKACSTRRVPHLACRGYTSQSEMFLAGQRIARKLELNKKVTILHFGDHDPSGIDMTRDIEERIQLFLKTNLDDTDLAWNFSVDRLALNFNQVEEYDPPPNPAKSQDPRFKDYRKKFGSESWELDAVEPNLLVQLIEDEIDLHVNQSTWDMAVEAEERNTQRLIDNARKLK